MTSQSKEPTVTVGLSLEEVLAICKELNCNWINGMSIIPNSGSRIRAIPMYMYDDFDTRCMIKIINYTPPSRFDLQEADELLADNIPPELVKGDNGILARIIVKTAIEQRSVGIFLGKLQAKAAIADLISKTIGT